MLYRVLVIVAIIMPFLSVSVAKWNTKINGVRTLAEFPPWKNWPLHRHNHVSTCIPVAVHTDQPPHSVSPGHLTDDNGTSLWGFHILTVLLFFSDVMPNCYKGGCHLNHYFVNLWLVTVNSVTPFIQESRNWHPATCQHNADFCQVFKHTSLPSV